MSASLLKPATSFSGWSNLSYSTAHWRCALDLYAPNNGSTTRPLVIWVHGGGWSDGDKTRDVAHLLTLVNMGFAVAPINYRFDYEARWPAQIRDVKAAVRAARVYGSWFGVWTQKIGLWGVSAGGHLAAFAAATNGLAEFDVGDNPGVSSAVAAAAADCPVTDLARWCAEPALVDPNPITAGLLGVSAGSPGWTEACAAASPSSRLSGDEPPMNLWHGTADTLVPPVQSIELRDRLQAYGLTVPCQLQDGYQHADARRYRDVAAMTLVGQWFDQYLRP